MKTTVSCVRVKQKNQSFCIGKQPICVSSQFGYWDEVLSNQSVHFPNYKGFCKQILLFEVSCVWVLPVKENFKGSSKHGRTTLDNVKSVNPLEVFWQTLIVLTTLSLDFFPSFCLVYLVADYFFPQCILK